MPCVPIAGPRSGIFVVLPIGAQVWVEFEGGDPDHPIWTGGFWADAAEIPASASVSPMTLVLQTTDQVAMILSDAPPTPTSGGLIVKSPGGATIVVNDGGIYISNGKGANHAGRADRRH